MKDGKMGKINKKKLGLIFLALVFLTGLAVILTTSKPVLALADFSQDWTKAELTTENG